MVKDSSRIQNEKRAVKTGIRLEKMLALMIPRIFTVWAKKTNDNEEARIASMRKEEMISRLGVTERARGNSKMRNRGRKRKIPIKFWMPMMLRGEYVADNFFNIMV